MRSNVPMGALAGLTEMTRGTWTVNCASTRSRPCCFSTRGPDSASSGTWNTMTSSFHWAMVTGRPPIRTASSISSLAFPNPWPNKTTLVPTGPLNGSTRMEGISFNGTALLATYSTGAQHEPSGSGSEEASRTMTSPLTAFGGISSSILSSFHRVGRTTTPPTTTSLTPNIVFGSRAPAEMPKFRPVIWSVAPRSASMGVRAEICGAMMINGPADLLFFPMNTSTGPLIALKGTLTSMTSASHRCTSAGTPLTVTRLNRVDLKVPNPFPFKTKVAPGVNAREDNSIDPWPACAITLFAPPPKHTNQRRTVIQIEICFIDSLSEKGTAIPEIHNTICPTLTSHFFESQGGNGQSDRALIDVHAVDTRKKRDDIYRGITGPPPCLVSRQPERSFRGVAPPLHLW